MGFAGIAKKVRVARDFKPTIELEITRMGSPVLIFLSKGVWGVLHLKVWQNGELRHAKHNYRI